MAIRIRTGFHAAGKTRSMAEQASVIGILAWKLAVDSIKRMREAGYDIEIGRAYFDFVCEFMVFLALLADRVAYADLSPNERGEFTTALVRRLAAIVEDNHDMRFDTPAPGECQQYFLDLYNRRSDEYAGCGFDASGPDFAFRRVFAACLQEILPPKDQLWAIDQVMEIEAPEAVRAVQKTLAGLFHPGVAKSRR